eukprot:5042226-Prymnesium_polylepis.1
MHAGGISCTLPGVTSQTIRCCIAGARAPLAVRACVDRTTRQGAAQRRRNPPAARERAATLFGPAARSALKTNSRPRARHLYARSL